jgi:hypothetical protein
MRDNPYLYVANAYRPVLKLSQAVAGGEPVV